MGVDIMGKIIKSLGINDLKEGMVLADDIEQNGKMLLGKDIAVNSTMINKLKDLYYLGEIKVYFDEEQLEDTVDNKKKIESDKIEEEFNTISIELKDVFEEIIDINGNVNNSKMKEIREFAKKIQDELKTTSIVIKNIVLYGSGMDSIYRHGVNVAALSALLGKWIGLEDKQINLLLYSAMLHDFGKIKIDDNVLNKIEPLTKSEFELIKTHTNIGYNFIKDINYLDKAVSYGVLMHHERMDGSGYPLGISGEGIHPFARIIAIADVFDAINSNRGYKDKKLPFEAMQIVKNESLGKLDYEYCKVFLEHIGNYYMGEEVLLNTGETCKIIQMDLNNIEKPLVFKDGDFIELSKVNDLYIKEIIL